MTTRGIPTCNERPDWSQGDALARDSRRWIRRVRCRLLRHPARCPVDVWLTCIHWRRGQLMSVRILQELDVMPSTCDLPGESCSLRGQVAAVLGACGRTMATCWHKLRAGLLHVCRGSVTTWRLGCFREQGATKCCRMTARRGPIMPNGLKPKDLMMMPAPRGDGRYKSRSCSARAVARNGASPAKGWGAAFKPNGPEDDARGARSGRMERGGRLGGGFARKSSGTSPTRCQKVAKDQAHVQP